VEQETLRAISLLGNSCIDIMQGEVVEVERSTLFDNIYNMIKNNRSVPEMKTFLKLLPYGKGEDVFIFVYYEVKKWNKKEKSSLY